MASSSRKWIACSTEKDFPEPSRYLVWRNRNRVSIYDNLSLVKTAVTYDTDSDGLVRQEFLVFEWDGTAWQQIYEIPKRSIKADHVLWKNGAAPKHKQTISDAEVQAAIASITGTKS